MTIITAHSGSDQTLENSLSFVELFSDERRISAIEVDVRLDRNEQLVLHHDELTKNKDYPKFEEVFKYLFQKRSHLLINCDLKEENLEEQVYQLAKENGCWSKVLLSGNVSKKFLKKNPKQILMNIENASNLNKISNPRLVTENDLIESLEELKKSGAEIININYLFFTEKVFRKGRELDLVFSIWTVNESDLIDDFFQKEVFNVTSRQALAYVKQREELLNEVPKS